MTSRRRLRSSIVAAGGLLAAAIVAAAAWDGWRLHQQVMAANERELGNLAQALVTGTLRSVLAVDVLLRDTASWYESTGRGLPGPAIEAALAARVVGLSQVSILNLVDAQGRQRWRSRVTGEPLADVSDRPYFTRQRDERDAGLVINEPVVTRSSREAALVVSRPLRTPDGRFDGVASAVVTLQELQGTYASIHLGAGSSLLLTLADGTLVVRQPPSADPSLHPRLTDIVALKGGSLVDHVTSPVDGRRKLVVALPVGNRPLVLAVTRDEAEALQPWYEEMVSGAVRTALLVAVVAAATAGLLYQLRRLETSERALRESEQRYAMAMEAANEGHAEWNLGGDGAFVSAKWRALHGVAEDAAVAGFADLERLVQVHPDDEAPARAALAAHLAGEAPAIDLEYRVRRADGDWHWIQARGRCVRGEDGTPLRLFSAANDITARKTAEAERATLALRLQQARRMEALGTLAGGIAHDFNNILGAILGFGDMAQQAAEPGSALRRHVDRVLQAGGRAKALVRRILEFSRSGVVEHVPVDLQAVVEEALGMLESSLPPGVTITTTLAAGSAVVAGDATRLHQVVMNLCTNAAQAMPEGGTISLELRPVRVDAPRHLAHGELAAGQHVRLCIADSGSGMPPEVLARIFEPFFTTKKTGEGTGLGLAVVHGIVGDLGGAIDVASRPGEGTQVSVWFPVHAGSAGMEGGADEEVARGDGEVVLVVDDERPLVELGEELLAELGYAPLAFGSPEAALAAFLADPGNVDAVLTDEAMPGMTGSELARAIRARRPDLPILMMSGHVDPGLERRARDAGVSRLLHKPLTATELARGLAQVLHGEAGAGRHRD